MNRADATEAMSKHAEPWLIPWPSDGLQRVDLCPVCYASERGVLHDNLIDNVFFVAARRFMLYRCAQCECVYLDSRPNEASTGKAYGNCIHIASGGIRLPFGRHCEATK